MTEQTPQERRHFSRIRFDAPVQLIGANRRWETSLIDISLKGALIGRPADWDGRPGDRVTLELPLDETGTELIRMEANVARAEPERVGLVCAFIDVDSIAHLRRLLELNLADPKLLERELAAMMAL